MRLQTNDVSIIEGKIDHRRKDRSSNEHSLPFRPKTMALRSWSPGYLLRMAQCYVSILRLNFVFLDLDSYDKYFRDDSTTTLAQAGVYKGVDAIREYVAFGHPESAFIEIGPVPLEEDRKFSGYDRDTGLCKFTSVFHRNFLTDATTTEQSNFNYVFMINLFLNPRERYIKAVNLYYPTAFLDFYMGKVLAGENTATYLCDLYENKCAASVTPTADCMADMAALPSSEGELIYFDGNSAACRALHGNLADRNPELHCAHISFGPSPDPNNAIKCQESAGILPTGLFSEDDIAFYEEFARSLGYDPEVGYVENAI
jgi:hypothetical protein